jgi:hypothetical protein
MFIHKKQMQQRRYGSFIVFLHPDVQICVSFRRQLISPKGQKATVGRISHCHIFKYN